jgi:hypothetical protein
MNDKDARDRELLSELDNEWHALKHGNPVPGLYPQTGAETVQVRGASRIEGEKAITRYEIVVTDEGVVVGQYWVVAEEATSYPAGDPDDDDR